MIDQALIDGALSGSHAHLLTAYERLENWIPRSQRRETGQDVPGISQEVWDAIGRDALDDLAEKLGRARRLAREQPARGQIVSQNPSSESEA